MICVYLISRGLMFTQAI